MKCGVTKKVCFKSHAGAMVRAEELWAEGSRTARPGSPKSAKTSAGSVGPALRAYKCEFCGFWHLTKWTGGGG